MNSRVTRGACALLAAVAMTAGPASAASAATWSHTDAKHDVQAMDPETEAVTPAPSNTNTDITSWKVAHNAGTVVVRVGTVSNLPRSGFLYLQIATSTAKFEVFTGKAVGGTHLAKANGTDVKCDGLKSATDAAHHRIQVTIPRTCIGSPHRVKVGAATVNIGTTWTFDDANKTGGNTDNVSLSPRVSVG